jgi:Na+-transporting NADH:ubiquinone oxidoreductase subunit E
MPHDTSPAHLLVILVSAALTDNILLTRFLGMCSYLAVSRQMKAALGLGLAVTFVTTVSCLLNSILWVTLLQPYGLESLQLILFIVVVAGFVQFLEMFIERVSLSLYLALGVFLPLITVNCAVLGAALFMTNRGYGVTESLVFGFGSGAGWMLAIVLMAGIRERLKNAQVPPALEGPGITLIITGIIALGFVGFSGLVQP